MVSYSPKTVQKATVIVIGCMLAGLGMATLYHPEFMVRYGLEVATPEARIATRAIIGGGELGFGAFLLFGGKLHFTMRQRLVLATVLFYAILIARILAVWLEHKSTLAPIVYRELFVEFIIVTILSAVLFLGRKPT